MDTDHLCSPSKPRSRFVAALLRCSHNAIVEIVRCKALANQVDVRAKINAGLFAVLVDPIDFAKEVTELDSTLLPNATTTTTPALPRGHRWQERQRPEQPCSPTAISSSLVTLRQYHIQKCT